MLPQVMRMHEDQAAPRPQSALVGKDSSGSFRTGAAKEYPPRLNGAIAACIYARWKHLSSSSALVRPEGDAGQYFCFHEFTPSGLL